MKHTPGPWFVDVSPDNTQAAIVDDEGCTILDIAAPFPNDIRADARLIAGAPDLLAALLHVMPHVGTNYSGKQRYDILKTASAAIAKATGEEL